MPFTHRVVLFAPNGDTLAFECRGQDEAYSLMFDIIRRNNYQPFTHWQLQTL